MSVILVHAGNNCKEYGSGLQAGKMLVLLAEQQRVGIAGSRHVSPDAAVALVRFSHAGFDLVEIHGATATC